VLGCHRVLKNSIRWGLFFIVGWGSISAQAAITPFVRVLIDRQSEGVRVEGFDVVVEAIGGDSAPTRVVMQHPERTTLQLDCKSLNASIRVVNQSLDLSKWFQAKARNLRVVGPLRISSRGGFLRVGAKQFRDALYVYSANQECVVVNHVDLEKYIVGLLNSEMSANWSLQALKAQAVAARTYAVYQMREAGASASSRPFDVQSTVKDQVYEGAHKERFVTTRAVMETQGQILTFGHAPIKAFYHSTCGGQTENPAKVWGTSVPYMKPVPCGYCKTSPRFKWDHSITYRELTTKLFHAKLVERREGVKQVSIAKFNNLGRAQTIIVKTNKREILMPAQRFREILGFSNVLSTRFRLDTALGVLLVEGRGSGHGVGLCQYGAKGMSDQGYSFDQILKHYYPLAKLEKMY
jgi:stage II sporulation protein D